MLLLMVILTISCPLVLADNRTHGIDYYQDVIDKFQRASSNFRPPPDAKQYIPLTNDVHDFGQFDFIVVGSGSAGSVIANRLTENGNFTVLLLEVGGFSNDFIRIPAMCGDALLLNEYNWFYRTVPQDNTCLGNIDRKCVYNRGKGIGGTSLLNGLVFSRGFPESYDKMAAMGNPGWSYQEVLPYFKKMESFSSNSDDAVVEYEYHGFDGPVNVEYFSSNRYLTGVFVKAANELGYNNTDYNAISPLGVSVVQAVHKSGQRWDAGRAYIEPILHRPNLHISTQSYATKVLISNQTASGVRFVKDGQIYEASALREVILSAGAIGSPHVLLNSGIGPAKHLKEVGVELVHDLEVGSNFRDQPGMYGLYFTTNHSDPEVGKSLKEKLRDYLKGTGLLGTSGSDALVFAALDQVSKHPDVELELTYLDPSDTYRKTFNYNDETWNAIWNGTNGTGAFTIQTILLFPKSVGTLRLKNNDPFEYPLIDPRQLSDPDDSDLENLYKAVQLALKLVETEPFRRVNAEFVNKSLPSCSQHDYLSKEYWKCYIKHTSIPDNHFQGTNPMGPDPLKGAVVDSRCRVHGIGKLRVADASVFPFAVANHPNAACMMVGERVSDYIKEDNK